MAPSLASQLPQGLGVNKEFESTLNHRGSWLASDGAIKTYINPGKKRPGATPVAPGFCCQRAADVVDPPPAVELDV
jgi:hypothetical protein